MLSAAIQLLGINTDCSQLPVDSRGFGLAYLTFNELAAWLESRLQNFTLVEIPIAEPILADMHGCVRRLIKAGKGYLARVRASPD